MISIIVCSRHKQIPKELETNIKSTIGDVKYEIVWIDNSDNQYNIFQAYNEGVRKSQGEYLCFMHEDILYHSTHWGECIIRAFEDAEVGMLGIAGTQIMNRFSIGWHSNYRIGKWIDGYRTPTRAKMESEIASNDVVAVDGVWMVIRKQLFEKISFDGETYNGFHFYDIDICMQVNIIGYKIHIVPDILIEHFSRGNFNVDYYQAAVKFHRKWDSYMPIMIHDAFSKEMIQEAEYFSQSVLMNSMGAYAKLVDKLNWKPYRIIDLLYKLTH